MVPEVKGHAEANLGTMEAEKTALLDASMCCVLDASVSKRPAKLVF